MGTKMASEVARCFMNGRSCKKGNWESTGNCLVLFGNVIARRNNGIIEITGAGWTSQSTSRGLNCLPGVSVRIKNGSWELNGRSWDGKWTSIQREDPFRRVIGMAKLADLLCEDKSQRNRCKTLAVQSIQGIDIPSDWDTLSEEEKERRLNGAIEELKK